MDALTQLLATSGFMPHGYCFQWTPLLLWTYVLSDSLIALAYYSIPVALWSFTRRRADIPFGWMFLCFAVFIFACGTTHLISVWSIWQPVYWLDAGVKAVTATVSVATAVLLWPLMPKALALPNPRALERANEALQREIVARQQAEQQLQRLNQELEARVATRTAELAMLNEELQLRDEERQRSTQSLLENQQLLQSILDNSATVIYVKHLSGRYLLVNRRYEALFHVTNPDMEHKTDYDLFPDEHADALRAVDQQVASTGEVVEAEENVPLDDGLHTYISVKFPIRDGSGRIYAVGGISTDITDRKHAEQALRDSEAQTRSIIETALDAVITMDRRGIITGWNHQAENTFGLRSDEALGRRMTETIIPLRFRDAHAQGLQRYLSTGQSRLLRKRLEFTALHRDGHEFPIELAITPIGAGERLCFSGFVRDITESKRAQARVQAQLQRMGLLDQITRAIGERQDLRSVHQVVTGSLETHLPADFSCVLRHDAQGTALTVSCTGPDSHALARTCGMVEHSLVDIDHNGLSRCLAGHLVHEPDIEAVDMPFPRKLAGAGLRALVMAPLMSESRVFGILAVARRQANSFSSGECEFVRQLSAHVALATQQAELYESLQRAYDDLRQTQQAVMQQERLRALGQMASGIAHDINNAISPVMLYAESLLEREPGMSPQGREQLESIARAADDVAATVARMREFYRPREQADLQPVEVNRLVRQVVDLTRARWADIPQQRGIVIDVHADLSPALPVVMGVESEIREALTNLIFNAVDAMPEGGRMTLRTRAVEPASLAEGLRRAPPRVEVSVSDTGVGMDEDTRRRCLEPFFTTKGERGTGLGLAMVYGVVQRHGAEIGIDSAPHRGTTVRLTFSAASQTPPQPQARRAAPAAVAHRLRILLVDDDPLLLRSLRDALEADGHTVVAAGGGAAGIEAARATPAPDVVITDLGMPHIDGRRVALSIKQGSPSTPVILLTGWGRRLLDDGDIPPHVDAVLSKPPKLIDLRDALARLCGRPNDPDDEASQP